MKILDGSPITAAIGMRKLKIGFVPQFALQTEAENPKRWQIRNRQNTGRSKR